MWRGVYVEGQSWEVCGCEGCVGGRVCVEGCGWGGCGGRGNMVCG